jgi:signal transduction histidine kinase/ActR/RegA family two-component response regulator
MMMTDAKRILVITGDYEIVRQVRQALQANTFSLQTAYSHLDSVYSLASGEFDAVLVDANMTDRRSGEKALLALARQYDGLPIIGLTSNGNGIGRLPSNVSLAKLDDDAIARTVAAALHLSVPDAAPQPIEEHSSGLRSSVEIQTLFSLSKSLTEVLDLGEVLNRVVEAARTLTKAEEGMILLPDGDQLYLRAKVGIDIEVARNFRVKTEDTLAGRVYSTGKPVLIGQQGPQKVKTEYLVNALLYVPILYEDRCIGVLGVNNKNTESIFTQRDEELLLNLAAFAAIAIENARHHEETLERTRELQILVEASQSLNASVSLDKTLPTICDQLMRVLNVNLSQIYEWNREANRLCSLAKAFKTVWNAGQGPTLQLADRPALQAAIESNRPAALNRANAPENGHVYLDQLGVAMVLYVPISGGSQPIGVAQFFYIREPKKIPEADLLQRLQTQALETLVTFSNQQGNASRQQAVFRAVEDMNAATGADWGELCIISGDRKSVAVSVAVGRGVWLSPPQPYLDLNQYPDMVETLQSQSMIINKHGDSRLMKPSIRALLDSASSRSILALPLVQRGQTAGIVLFADARRTRVFSQRDVDMGRAIVGQASTALENARLVHDLERSLAELRDTQDRLVQTARLSAMGELAAAVAHQINNPLTTIMVDSEMMLQDEPDNSPNAKSLQAINRAGKRAAGVARRLLAIARPKDPETPPERVDVIDTIEGVLSLVKSHIERDHIEIVSKMPPERVPPIWAVPGQLDDIWLNLLMNAHDALMGREGATIGVEAGYQPGDTEIKVVVWDNGPGIPANIIGEIFKPFFTTKPVGEGTGLGLHICRQVAERVGGTITVKSIPNEGTRFTVTLPIRRGGNEL